MTVILDRPYQFIPPNRNDLWPAFIQKFRIFDYYLRKKEGVVSYDCRNIERLKQSIASGAGVLLAPNHCRYADPLVLGWCSRHSGRHVYAMASWHLFNNGWFDAFAINRMGGFSIFREGSDRQALETAIEILVEAHRALILFPEGTTNRTNDALKPLLEGVTFIARTASRRRHKKDGGKTVVHPVAIKYLSVDKIDDWANAQLSQIESQLGWQKPVSLPLLGRTLRVVEALLALREVEYFGKSRTGPLPARRDELIEHLLSSTEQRMKLENAVSDANESNVRARVRVIRSEVHTRWFSRNPNDQEKRALRGDLAAADLAQELFSYPDNYLQEETVTDMRLVETIQRMQETLFGKADSSIPLHAVIEVDESINVPAEKAPRGVEDPILTSIRESLTALLENLSGEARPVA
ncbi:Acyltransferase [Novipirellula aureliae]|uniref:Acyltransferase n=1 Tax=Novipirellula aureliae TaxID=2527966 RepID=A0A5C6DEM3_9BACT|nr:1-acyl-sn-glycerol-3-phosphate acyltransferase [Novipirellula aureliae]TWU35673.1 Acyltransferase [Novipirellula aureliae]